MSVTVASGHIQAGEQGARRSRGPTDSESAPGCRDPGARSARPPGGFARLPLEVELEVSERLPCLEVSRAGCDHQRVAVVRPSSWRSVGVHPGVEAGRDELNGIGGEGGRLHARRLGPVHVVLAPARGGWCDARRRAVRDDGRGAGRQREDAEDENETEHGASSGRRAEGGIHALRMQPAGSVGMPPP